MKQLAFEVTAELEKLAGHDSGASQIVASGRDHAELK